MSNSAPQRVLRGRRGECGTLDQVVADARAGRSQVLVLRGEAGIGKSALVEYLAGNAAGCQILRAVGVESEMELAFAGLHQLCIPMMGHLDRLPEPQRDALAVAFGLSAGSAPDRFMVGLAVLSLLAEAAEEQPLVCVVDDAQWLDRVSAQTLAFVARRLFAERVALVFAVRTAALAPGDAALAGLPELVVRGLRDDDARALLDSVVPGRLDERVRDRVVAETRGNPLALLELTRGLTAAELAGGFGRPDARPLASQIEQSFLRRIGSLPDAAQRLLLAAAAEPVGDLPLLRRVAERLDIGADAAGLAEAAGLIEFGARVRFHHPLVRSAAYRAADPGVRRDVHRALAEATDPDFDSDRQAWHRAHAAVEPDEALAGELERSAGRAQARGGIAAAAAFLRRATELTPDPARRGKRAVAAAQVTFEAGTPDAALELLAAAEMGPLDEVQHARLTRLRAQIVFARRRGGEALPLLLDAAGRLERADEGQAREAYLDAIGAAVFAGRLSGPIGVREVAEAALAAPRGPQPPRPADVLLDGLATWFAEGCVEGAALLKPALLEFQRAAGRNEDDVVRWLWLTWLIAGDMWDDETWHVLTTHAVRAARETGALNFLPLALTYRAGVHVHAGEFDLASALVDESDTITEVTGNSPLAYPSLLLLAWRGEDTRAPEVIQSAVQDATSWGEGRAIGLASYLLAVLYNGLGRYQEAVASAQQAGSTRIWRSSGSPSSNSSRRALAVMPPKWPLRPCAGSRNEPAPAARTGPSAFWPGRERCSATVRPPTCCTARPSSTSSAAGSPSTSPAPTWCTASGSAARTGASTRASTCAPPTRCCRVSEQAPSPNVPVANSWPPASRYGNARSKNTRPSPRRKPRSPDWPPTERRTPKSAPSCSSALAPSNGTCTRCSPSSTSTRGTSCAERWAAPDRRESPRRARPRWTPRA